MNLTSACSAPRGFYALCRWCMLVGCIAVTNPATAESADWGSGARTEIQAGLSPRTYGSTQTSEPTVAIELLPTAAYRLSSPESSLVLRFQQRWYIRQPNLLDYARPLLMNRLSSAYRVQLSPRLTFTATGAAVGGATDFSAAPALLQPSAIAPPVTATSRPVQPTVSRASVLQVLQLSAATGLGYQLSVRHSTTLALSASRQVPIANDRSGIPATQLLSVSVGHGYQISQRTQITSSLTGAGMRGGTGSYESAAAQTALSHVWSPRTSATATGGVTGFKGPLGGVVFFPNLGASLAHLRGPESRLLTLTAAASLSGLFDQMSGTPRSRLAIGLSATRTLRYRWSLGIRTDVTMPTSMRPVESSAGQQRVAETSATASVNLGRRLGDQSRFDTGMRYMLVGSHPTQFDVLTQQSWVYVAFSIWNGTDEESHGGWVL